MDYSKFSDSELIALKSNKFESIPTEKLLAIKAGHESTAVPQDPTLSGDISKDYSSAVTKAQDIKNQYAQGKIGYPEAIATAIGDVGAPLGSAIIGDVASAGFRQLPSPLQRGIESVGRGISSAVDLGGNAAGYVMNKLPGGAAYTNAISSIPQSIENNPYTRAIKNVALLGAGISAPEMAAAPVVRGAGALLGKARSGINAASDAAGVTKAAEETMPITNRPVSAPGVTSEEAKKVAQDIYRASSEHGGMYSPQFTGRFATDLNDIKTESKFTGIGKSGNNEINTWIDDFQKRLSKESMSLNDFEVLDQELGDLANSNTSNYGYTKTGKDYLSIQRKLRSAIESPIEGDTVDPSGFEAAKIASKVYAQHFKLKDIERVIDRAERTDNPAQSMRTGFKNLYLEAKKGGKYTEEELNYLDKASKTGIGTDALRLASSKLNSIGALASGHPLLAIGAYGAGKVAGKIATKVQKIPVNKLTNIIGKNVSGMAAEAHGILKPSENKITDIIKKGKK